MKITYGILSIIGLHKLTNSVNSALEELAGNGAIIIKRSDKGGNVVVLDSNKYKKYAWIFFLKYPPKVKYEEILWTSVLQNYREFFIRHLMISS